MSRRTLPWAAGVFDSLGWIKIVRQTSKGPRYTECFSLRAVVSVRQRVITDQLETEFKGHTTYMKGHKRCFWQVTDRQAVKFLTAIKPYVVSKQKQIDLGLAFAERKSKYRYLKDMSGQEKRDEQDDFRARLLEARGRLPEGASHV